MESSRAAHLHDRIRDIIESARTGAARSVNTAQVVSNWLIGREIIEEEQKGRRRAGYGEWLMRDLATRLNKEYRHGYSLANLKLFKQFYLAYADFIDSAKGYAVRSLLRTGEQAIVPAKFHALRGESSDAGLTSSPSLPYDVGAGSWKPGLLHPNLSWTHYRALLKVDELNKRAFYEIEAIKNNWSARELERQMASLLYERLAMSRDKKGLMRLTAKGHEARRPADVFKDPVVMEFLGLPESSRMMETELEEALIGNLQGFLLEMGKGFAFVARQERLTLDGDHFYIDLVFYHAVLKCYVIIDIKAGKLTHQDIGQLQLYVNYYDRERRSKGDNPTLGLILCADKNDAVVRYTLGPDKRKTIFTSRYKLHLPSEAELRAELRREVKALSSD
ncbi:MAG: PDDEXK nuclease domain-containing protein [Elusimicrobiota bacterium]|jgi:predicted nuclease of restriction endonuclease-like (RecB) superfamily